MEDIANIFNNYKSSITFKIMNYGCTSVTYIILYTNYTSVMIIDAVIIKK